MASLVDTGFTPANAPVGGVAGAWVVEDEAGGGEVGVGGGAVVKVRSAPLATPPELAATSR